MNIKINLASLKHSRRTIKGQSGDLDCLVLPLKANNLFVGEKGIYLDMVAHELKSPKTENNQKQTHLVKQSLPKEVYNALSDDERKEQPILGNVSIWAGNNSTAQVNNQDQDDDLPF